MLSPHFPPDGTAGAHRVRLLAPHLAAHGWQPTVVSVDPRDYEGRIDPELLALVPPDLEVVRCRALPARATRRLGVGDLGLRALPGLMRACTKLLAARRYDALFITIYPTYPALLGPLLKRAFRVPFVLDYQDPWVGAWGRTVGGGPRGAPDRKSRLSRALAARLEPIAVGAADAVTAVSRATFDEVRARHPSLAARPFCALPIGFDAGDWEPLRRRPRRPRWYDPGDGRFHLCSVGTLLPLGMETLEAVLAAAALVRARTPALFARLRLHFFGTSNRRDAEAPATVLPRARALGLDGAVDEVAPRLDYLDALAVQAQADALLLLGSSERHYTASRLFPALGAARPLLAVYHRASSVCEILARAARPPSVRLVTYDEAAPAATRVEAIAEALGALLAAPAYEASAVDGAALDEFSAPALAGRQAALLDGLEARRC
jgi:glycosyltransferase involved in cell wall biosynthesis